MRILNVLILLLLPLFAHSVTVVKNLGHGDCYMVISDGNVVLIDAGRSSNGKGIYEILSSGIVKFDRIVITHIHADHMGGLLSIGEFMKKQDSLNPTEGLIYVDKIASNHGQHDLKMVINSSSLRELSTYMKEGELLQADDQYLKELAFESEHLRLETYKLNVDLTKGENRHSLIVKVTEIRDGIPKATLFLGDLEHSEQKMLLTDLNNSEIFENVVAVTLPHHARVTTLWDNFFDSLNIKLKVNPILIHSDKYELDEIVAAKAKENDFIVHSTVNIQGDIHLDHFLDGKTYHIVKNGANSLNSILDADLNAEKVLKEAGFTRDEILEAISSYANVSLAENLIVGRVISWPSFKWQFDFIAKRRSSQLTNICSEIEMKWDMATEILGQGFQKYTFIDFATMQREIVLSPQDHKIKIMLLEAVSAKLSVISERNSIYEIISCNNLLSKEGVANLKPSLVKFAEENEAEIYMHAIDRIWNSLFSNYNEQNCNLQYNSVPYINFLINSGESQLDGQAGNANIKRAFKELLHIHNRETLGQFFTNNPVFPTEEVLLCTKNYIGNR